jgi:tRNA (cytidine/uridine-2'-O-)-methyltransferase
VTQPPEASAAQRLRAPPRPHPFHIALVEPEIPPNTGNIARLCAATCCPLHLVGPLGFRIDEKSVRRAGLDYWHLVQVQQHPSLPALEANRDPSRTWLFTGKTTRSYLDLDFQLGDLLVFGKESVGLPEELLAARPQQCVAIPTLGPVRSLNLANSVAIALFEALRRTGCLDLPSDSG